MTKFLKNSLKQALREYGNILDWNIVVFDRVQSTSSTLLAMLSEEKNENIVVISDVQTAGRGRSGRFWYSENGDNLYISASFRVTGNLSQIFPMVPLAAGISAAEVLQGSGCIDLLLKWPNDLLLYGKKVGGILCETPGLKGDSAIAVVGMGLNINNNRFPDELAGIATELTAANAFKASKEMIAAGWLVKLYQRIQNLIDGNSAGIVQDWKKYGEPFGRKVRAGGETGITYDMAPSGRLLIKTDSGKIVDIPGGIVESL